MANEAVVSSRNVELRPVPVLKALQTKAAQANAIPRNTFNTVIVKAQCQYQDDHYAIKISIVELSVQGTQKLLYVKMLDPSPNNIFLLTENLADIAFTIEQNGRMKILALRKDRNFVFDLNIDLMFAERLTIQGYVNFQRARQVSKTRNISPALGFYYRSKKMIA